MGKVVFTSYDELIAHQPKLKEVFSEAQWNVVQKANDHIGELYLNMWLDNVRKNCTGKDSLFDKHGTISQGCKGLGRNRAVIGIGAGPSLKKNMDVLRDICTIDAEWEYRTGDHPFIFISSNHMLKPLLKEGIIPHFVMLCDGSDVVYDQLCKDIPSKAKGVVLLCPIRASNKVLKAWDRQGRSIKFYIGDNETIMAEFTKLKGYCPQKRGQAIGHGGNVVNQMWVTGTHFMQSQIFISVGNDLSYDYDDSLEKRRKTYYADGDYSTNLATGRDEAKRFFPWMGFSMERSIIAPSEFLIKFAPRTTTGQLYLYKTWMENQVAVQERWRKSFHYYNCSEGGILGVMSREPDPKKMFEDKNNWFMFDELFPNRWHTRTLEQATEEILTARRMLWETNRGILTNVSVAPLLA